MYTVYVLYSSLYDKIYIGYTSDLTARLLSHNVLGKRGWTMGYRPWTVVYTEQYNEKSEALSREKELKTTVYVLYSSLYDKIYIGYTSDLTARLLSHNELGKRMDNQVPAMARGLYGTIL